MSNEKRTCPNQREQVQTSLLSLGFFSCDQGENPPRRAGSPIKNNRVEPSRTWIISGPRNLTALLEVMPVEDIACP